MTQTSGRYTTLLLCTLLLSGCARLPFTDRAGWSYLHPPKLNERARFPAYGVWCDRSQKAIFTATTGFLADGCSAAMPDTGSYTVVGIEHIAQNDVRTWVVEAMDSAGNRLWIPLPDHNWA